MPGSDVTDTDVIDHLTVEEAAELLGTPAGDLREMARERWLLAEKVSGRWWFPVEVVEEVRRTLVKAHEQHPDRGIPCLVVRTMPRKIPQSGTAPLWVEFQSAGRKGAHERRRAAAGARAPIIIYRREGVHYPQ